MLCEKSAFFSCFVEVQLSMKILAGLLLIFTATVSGFYTSSDDVVELTPSNFNNLVIHGEGLWLVEFYAPWCGHCQNLAPEWKKAAKALKGVVGVGAVDMDKHQSLGAPYEVGTNKYFFGIYLDYVFCLLLSAGQRTAQSIVDTALSHLKTLVQSRLSGKYSGGGGGSHGTGGSSGGSSDDVIELNDQNFEKMVLQSDDMWLVEFFAPWCGHCKNLAPQWASAATELKGKVKLGALDATVNTVMANRFGVRGYPTIKYFPAGGKDGSAEEYDGGRTSTDIVQWAMDKVAENIPPPELLQLIDGKVLKTACQERQLCMIAILPHILDCQSNCRNDYLDVLKRMGEKYKKRMWGWVWAEAGSQLDAEEALGIGGFGYPAMAAINARKMKFALMKGSFSETGINEFLRELAVGRGSTAPLKDAKLPDINNIEPWDGKDGELPVDEDIDLSDVELDDLDDFDKKEEL
ncbi:hypothetical protein LSH36_804g00025 [Paralvinella palmiformis]|uniref:protein disulfide-isomerase n=1 Tax=Paralvinella palmiformis TaxID=53620 RepID=A0AAD9MU37_9ANNE|nr:hypothetical protein LSH36_804g00025 [Paralvinella palmiformis]